MDTISFLTYPEVNEKKMVKGKGKGHLGGQLSTAGGVRGLSRSSKEVGVSGLREVAICQRVREGGRRKRAFKLRNLQEI